MSVLADFFYKFFTPGHSSFSQPGLPRLCSDGMVLQRDTVIRIRGRATAGREVVIRFAGSTYSTTTGRDRLWNVLLPPMQAGGPYVMEITADKCFTIKDILLGDVWVCSGQSNIVLPVSRVKELYADVVADSENNFIRQFKVPDSYDFAVPQEDLPSGSWAAANPVNVLDFSAVGYFFARTLFEKYRVPVGLITAGVGGATAAAWMSREALGGFPAQLAVAAGLADSAYLARLLKKDKAVTDAWHRSINRQDKGLAPRGLKWFDNRYAAHGWNVMRLPVFWNEAGLPGLNGVVWFRKEIDVPVSMTGVPAKLYLGRIVDSDTVYINGVFAGTTSYQYPPRIYELPADKLVPGKNVITVRVVNTCGQGGFAAGKPYCLAAAGRKIDLSGEWQYKVGAVAAAPLPEAFMLQKQPLGLFNGMAAPLTCYPVKGVLWYQGESDAETAAEYRKQFPVLIADWRKKWQQADLPFLYVQLPNFGAVQAEPGESGWAELRAAQQAALELPHTAMVVAMDVGEGHDLHPLNKKDVGNRLALAAQHVVYGEKDVVYSGPVYKSMQIQGDAVMLSFAHTGSGLMVKNGGRLRHFAIAGSDHKFVWAEAEIADDKVIVRSSRVAAPVAVRYAWADNPEGANLYNREGLPAAPFTTEA